MRSREGSTPRSTSSFRAPSFRAARPRTAAAVLAALAIVPAAACHDRVSPPGAEESKSSALTIESRRVTISLPAGVDLRQVAVGAKGNLQVGNGAHILTTTGGFAPSTNADLGASTTSVYGIESRVGPITSTAAVSLQDRAQVSGSVVSGRTVTRGANVTVSGAITQNAVLTPVQEISWTVDFPLATTDVTANSGQTRTLTPGAYRNVTAFSNGTVSLSAGTYYLNQLDIEPQARLVLNAAAGPIVIYVRTTLIVRGSMTGATADKLLLAFLGPATQPPPAIDASFNGTLVSSSAPVRLGVGSVTHSGAVFASGVQLDPNVRFTFRSFVGWDAIAFNVIPTLTCIERRSNGTYAAVLGYDNLRTQPVTVAFGAGNGFVPSPQNHGQPTTFLPGRHPSTFSIDFGSAQTLTWQLSGTSLALARTGPACTQPAPIALAQDTTAVKASPRESFGASTTLTVGPGKHTLVAFDRAAIKRQLGPGRYVTRATLELTAATAGATPAVEAKVLYRPWTEAGATWSCADDTNASPTGETCAPGSVWDLEPEELPGVNPWAARGQNRVVGTWAAGKVTFDVTRDTWNLLGAEGVRRGMSWAVVLQPDATGAADLRSRESAQPPRLLLEVSTRPEVDPAGSAPLDFVVDTSLVPQSPLPPPGLDGTPRPVAALRDPAGRRVDFVANELFVRVRTAAELSALVSRWNGTVINQATPPAGSRDPSILAEVRIDSARANAAALLARALEIDNRPRGVHAFSSAAARATMAAGLEEAATGTRVGLNWVARPDLPTTQNWIDRVINDGPAGPGVAAPQPGSNAFLWPGYATCTQDLADPPCVEKLPDGSPIVQALRIADGWRALALSGRMVPGGVLSALIDADFDASNPDYPPNVLVDIFGQSASRHGHFMLLAGYGLVGNDYGGVGPGGPVASVVLAGFSTTVFGSLNAFLVARAAGARVASMSWHVEIPAAGNIINLGHDSEEIAAEMPFFASAGNDNEYIDQEQCLLACWESTSFEPCENEGVNCVEGLAYNSYNRDPGSNWGPSISFAAPWWPMVAAGTTATPPDFMILNGGTSSATAIMGGIASMLVAANPSASKSEVLRCLREGSLITAGNGFGRVPNVLRSIRCMMTGSVFGDIPANVVIEVPATGATVAQGQLTQIRAVATDYETANPVISWSSNIDGPLAQTTSGQNGFAVFATPGTHTVTAAAAGTSTTVTVTVAAVAPSVLIVNPALDGQTFSAGTPVPLAAQASGLPAPPCTSYRWSSVAAGGAVDFSDVGGCGFQATFSVLGGHTVTVTVTDPVSGLSSSASRTLNIQAATIPVLSIVSPGPLPNGQTVILQDELATLTATANFPVDNYFWSILVNGSEYAVGSGPGSANWRPDTLFNHTCQSIPATLRVNVAGPPALATSIPVYLRPSTAINQELGCIH